MNSFPLTFFVCPGEVSDSDESDSDSSDSQEEFNDGYDENLMGDEEDRRRLEQMTEKEREQEIFKRIEQREVMKTRQAINNSKQSKTIFFATKIYDLTKLNCLHPHFLCFLLSSYCSLKLYTLFRFEIEKKLRLAKKQEMKKKKGGTTIKKREERMDPKERSKERKKTVEENRGKVDKKAQAMNLLKARREERKERGLCFIVLTLKSLQNCFAELNKNLSYCFNKLPQAQHEKNN